ncbi:MAG TPA: DNA repair protein RecN [Candidatus Polarisedimenticolaceae bacterium]|nr:DNA repair protein RecN [Candidatus Polarisedimenticolaceae bacterium]
MLKTLRIRNLVTIEDLEVDFAPGLNVLTGETGAGKSILVDALGLCAGERADLSLVRGGADRAVVEAVFEARGIGSSLETRGLDADGDGVVVRREVGGSGRALVNGSPTTVAILRDLGARLLERHGQHESRGLLDPDAHLDLLDAFGAHDDALASVAVAHGALAAAEDHLGRLQTLERDAARRSEELGAVVREVRGLAPFPGEVERLRFERVLLQNGAVIDRLLEEAIGRLDEGEAPAIGGVHAAERRLLELGRIDPSFDVLAERLRGTRVELEDVRDSLGALRDKTRSDASRLEALETRCHALERLLLKWGPEEADALAAADAAEGELATISGLDAELGSARAAAEEARKAYRAAAAVLTERRREAARALGPAVERELAPLALPKARFGVELRPSRDGVPSPRGAERAEFLLAPNPGEPARPLARAASGGELSRAMLALHVVLDRGDGSRAIVFDEVDAGVSGAVALAVGERLARLAKRHQVLCVTHLPQVAAAAAVHYHVRKRVEGGRTRSEIVRLAEEARVDELARMLGGREAGAAARANAAELLVEAGGTPRARGRR